MRAQRNREVAGAGRSGKNALVEATTTEILGAPEAGAVGQSDVALAEVRDRSEIWLRVVCHLVVELPLVVFGIAALTKGWRPLFDNADLALRSYQVFSSHSPSLGHQMAVSVGVHAVFGPGPLQSWILAVPVRIDPAQGALWGAVLAAVAAVAAAIEAGWTVGRWRGVATIAGSVLVIAVARPEVVLDPVWNVWFAVIFLMATFTTALAVATGRLWWWPVTVVVASVVVQSQAAFGPLAAALCIAAPVLGLVARRRVQGSSPGWLATGFGAGMVLWIAPIGQEITHRPGNLTLLAQAVGSQASIGLSTAFRALGGATRMPPHWVDPLPTGGGLAQFYGVAAMVDGPEWWGLAVLVLLAVIGGAAAWTGRRTLAMLAMLAVVLAVGGVVMVASIPTSQFLVLGYLGSALALAGLAVWVTFAWAAGEVILALALALAVALGSGVVKTDDNLATVMTWARWPAAVVLAVLSVWLMASGLGQMGSVAPTLSGWPAVRAADLASEAAARVAPAGPFRLQVDGPQDASTFAIETGVAYQLVTRGLDPRPSTAVGYPTFGRPPPDGPIVVLVLPGPGRPVSAHLRSKS
jgi:hypothetical protein